MYVLAKNVSCRLCDVVSFRLGRSDMILFLSAPQCASGPDGEAFIASHSDSVGDASVRRQLFLSNRQQFFHFNNCGLLASGFTLTVWRSSILMDHL